jgi:hypothetical protein
LAFTRRVRSLELSSWCREPGVANQRVMAAIERSSSDSVSRVGA